MTKRKQHPAPWRHGKPTSQQWDPPVLDADGEVVLSEAEYLDVTLRCIRAVNAYESKTARAERLVLSTWVKFHKQQRFNSDTWALLKARTDRLLAARAKGKR